jgi:hypothetical protein
MDLSQSTRSPARQPGCRPPAVPIERNLVVPKVMKFSSRKAATGAPNPKPPRTPISWSVLGSERIPREAPMGRGRVEPFRGGDVVKDGTLVREDDSAERAVVVQVSLGPNIGNRVLRIDEGAETMFAGEARVRDRPVPILSCRHRPILSRGRVRPTNCARAGRTGEVLTRGRRSRG